MDKTILDRISAGAGIPDLVDLLSERISASDLNSLLLEVFDRKTQQTGPAALMRAYRQNRFVQPAAVDAIGFTEYCLEWLKDARDAGFLPLQLSPVSPLGTCSVMATAHQNKILSALRGTEVVADATNVLALESTVRRIEQNFPVGPLHLSTVHRHVRTQEVPRVPGFSAHFAILGLTSAGRDTGSFQFEKENLRHQIAFYKTRFEQSGVPVKIRLKALDPEEGENRLFRTVVSWLQETEPGWQIEVIPSSQKEQGYYHRLQFKIVVPKPGGGTASSRAATMENEEIEIADGGFTDWTQQLSGNRKERLLISGMGLELWYKVGLMVW